MNKVHLTNEEEETFWKQSMITYMAQGGSVEKGAHLKFADRVILALRKRQEPTNMVTELKRYQPHGMTLHKFNGIVQKAVQSVSSKIPAIKEVRTHTGLGLKEAKELAETPDGKVLEGEGKEAATDAKSKLETAGASVDVD